MSFESLGQLFESMDGMVIRYELMIDDDGYLDHECPREECRQFFKTFWEDLNSDARHIADLYCPACRHASQPVDFSTPAQADFLGEVVAYTARQHLSQEVQRAPSQYRGRRHQGFVSLKWDVTVPPTVIPVSPQAEDALTLRIVCDECTFRYAVVGAAYFCPACGHNSAKQTIGQTIRKTRDIIDLLPKLRAAIDDRDKAEVLGRSMIESQVPILVMAFQRFAEAIYPQLPEPIRVPRRNAFQNLTEGSELWEGAGGKPYSGVLDASEMADIAQLFQKRHVLVHSDGIVDQTYLERSGDTSYSIGQRLSVRESEVLRLAFLVEKLKLDLYQQTLG